jgi:hypothetical protein
MVMWHEIPRYDYAYDRKINELHSTFIMLLAIGWNGSISKHVPSRLARGASASASTLMFNARPSTADHDNDVTRRDRYATDWRLPVS